MQHIFPICENFKIILLNFILPTTQTPNTPSFIDLNILQIVSPVYIPWLKAGDRNIEINKREVTSGLTEFIIVVA